MKKTKVIPKVYKTTITLEVVHVGEFKAAKLAHLQSANIVSHLGDLKINSSVEPEITVMQNSSEEITLKEAKTVLGPFWEQE